MKKSILSVLFLAILSTAAFAQSFTVSAEIRTRAEYRDGYKKLLNEGDNHAKQISQRTRLNFAYQHNKLETYISFQDVRFWGEIPGLSKTSSLFLNEAWAKMKLGSGFAVKFGRQSLIYDNQRLMSNNAGWNQVSRKHEALKFTYRKDGWELDFATAYNQTDNLLSGTYYDQMNAYKTLNVFWISKKAGDFKLSTLHIFDGFQDENDSNNTFTRYTPGLSITYAKNDWKLYSSFYYQTGSITDNKDIAAYFYSIEASKKLNKNISLVAGFETMSGNKTDDSNNNAFDILYGKRHGANGFIDYYHTPGSTKGAGLINSYLKFKSKLGKKSNISIDYHCFRLQQNTISTGQTFDNKRLGSEIDFTYKYKYNKDVMMQLGYSMMFASETAKVVKGGNEKFGQFAYFMITIKPTLFSSK
jgi:hypothetical protein